MIFQPVMLVYQRVTITVSPIFQTGSRFPDRFGSNGYPATHEHPRCKKAASLYDFSHAPISWFWKMGIVTQVQHVTTFFFHQSLELSETSMQVVWISFLVRQWLPWPQQKSATVGALRALRALRLTSSPMGRAVSWSLTSLAKSCKLNASVQSSHCSMGPWEKTLGSG